MVDAKYRPLRIPKMEELDWRVRKKPVVPDEFKAASRPYLIRRPDPKHGRCESFRSYQKGVGKLENGETKVEYEPNASHRRWKRSRKRPECRCKHLEPKASVVKLKTGNIEGQSLPRGKQAMEKSAASGTSRMQSPKVIGGRCIEYKGPENNRKDAGKLEKVDKLRNDTKRVKNAPNDQKNPENHQKVYSLRLSVRDRARGSR